MTNGPKLGAFGGSTHTTPATTLRTTSENNKQNLEEINIGGQIRANTASFQDGEEGSESSTAVCLEEA